jgi:hypothetical protein
MINKVIANLLIIPIIILSYYFESGEGKIIVLSLGLILCININEYKPKKWKK